MSAAAQRVVRSDPTAPGIEFEAVSVAYDDGADVVSGVELTVQRGELVGLIGPNGAGKSTLLKAIIGSARVRTGAVRVAGVPLAELEPKGRARIVAVVPQALPTLFAFTAREFVEMGRHPHLGSLERTSDADRTIVDRVMEITDTLRLAEESADTLSGGDLQRLTLAQALAQEPEVLLLDEPTSHLDLNHRLQVLDLVRDLADSGLAVLGVFHDLDLAARYGDRLAVVHDGGLGPCGPPADVLTPELLRKVFSVRAVVGTDAVTGSVAITPVLREQSTPAATRGSVFVVGGSGAAAPLMRRLALAGYAVSSGALNAGDVDEAVAEALGARYVALPPFGAIDREAQASLEALAAEAEVRVVAGVPFGGANLGNLAAVVAAGPPLVFVGGFDPARDFTNGEALALADSALAAGAVRVDGIEATLRAVHDLIGAQSD